MSRPFIYRFFLLAFLFSICLTSAGQAYTESELNNRINEIANGISDVTDMNQVSDFFNLMGFSISIYQSNLGTPLAEQYVNQILFNSYCTSDELKGMISFLKKYMRGKTNYSENEKASFHAAVLIYAREVALSESELREKKFREEEKKKKADLENDNCLKQTVLEFIDYYCNLAHEDVYSKCFKTLQKFDVDPSRIIRHDNNETRSLEMNVRHYARSFEQRNPDIDSLITSTDFSFSDIGSFASYVRSTPDSNLKLVVAAYKSFISSKYFQLLKISCRYCFKKCV